MSFDAKTLYELLPAVHRVKDAALGFPLRQLVDVIAGQVAVIEDDIEQLYDNYFGETAAAWALPYIADLLAIRGVSTSAAKSIAPRAEVGHTIAYRRRKGTAATLELVARDVTGWPTRALEFFERMVVSQHLNHVRPQPSASLSLRAATRFEAFGSPFETAAHTCEVRRIEPARGRYDIPNIGVFSWRTRAFSLRRTPLVAGPLGERHLHMHPLGCDLALFNRPETEDTLTRLSTRLNVPAPISRRLLQGSASAATPQHFHPDPALYAAERSIYLERELAGSFTPVNREEILVADLSDRWVAGTVVGWGHDQVAAQLGKVLLDPVLARVVLPAVPNATLYASYHYGSAHNIGGGEYQRAASISSQRATHTVAMHSAASFHAIDDSLAAAAGDSVVIEVQDSDRYPGTLTDIELADRRLTLRANDQRRPSWLLNPAAGVLTFRGSQTASLSLDGLLIAGATLRIAASLGRVRVSHCTLLPSFTLDDSSALRVGPLPSLSVEVPGANVELDSCILGPIRVAKGAHVTLRNCIVDAGSASASALSGLDGESDAGSWTLDRCTVRGTLALTQLELASNSILFAERAAADDPARWPPAIVVRQRQHGCVRFCWLPPAALTPRRHRCLPDATAPDARPSFASLGPTDARYFRLAELTPVSIRRGADDESELGVYHDLFEPQREAYLRARLQDYLRFGLEIGLFFAS